MPRIIILLIVLLVIAAFPIIKDFTQNNKPNAKMQIYIEQVVKNYIMRNAKEVSMALEDVKKKQDEVTPEGCYGTTQIIE